jgi:acyl-CoA synthetase (AMP-forming)/AMP-acid ligase II
VIAGRTIGDALVAAAASPHGLRVIEHDGRLAQVSYRELLLTACRIGGALQARGCVPGDRVALVIPEVGAFIETFFGIVAAGLVPVPLCPPAQAGDLATFARQSRHILEAARARAVVTTADVAPLVDTCADVVLFDSLHAAAPLDAPATVPLESTALLQFTSGSTALPKGVVLSHGNIAANVAAILGPAGLDAREGDVAVSWLPLYHDMGLIGMLLSSLYHPADAVIMSPVLFLKRPSAWLDAIAAYRGTVSFAPNFAYELCRRRVKTSQLDTLDLSRWRVAGCGAEPIRPDTLLQFADYFRPTGFDPRSFLPSYGLAEHSLAVTFARGGVHVDVVDAERLVRDSRALPAVNGSASVRVVRCGTPFPGHEIRIVDDNFNELPERQVGAIVARGPSVMQGYFDDPAATAEALRDGWLFTGDLGYLADGALHVCGRTKDLIIRQGRKYHPADIESSLADLQGVALSGVVVFAVNHVEDADEVVAVLETRAGGRADDIDQAVRRRIRETAGLEIDRVVITPPGTIPRTTSGKVRRAETRIRLEAGTLVR